MKEILKVFQFFNTIVKNSQIDKTEYTAHEQIYFNNVIYKYIIKDVCFVDYKTIFCTTFANAFDEISKNSLIDCCGAPGDNDLHLRKALNVYIYYNHAS